MTFSISSSAFANNAAIPDSYAQAGKNKSPPLQWHGAPEGTRSFALILEDHDAPAGTFTHWAVYDIPAETCSLAEGLRESEVDQGSNDMGHRHYDGPKPPKGHGVHRYHFRLVALDVPSLGLSGDPDFNAVKNAARTHVIAETRLVGTFETK